MESTPGRNARARILSEARRLFAEKGFGGATTAELARRAGVAEGTLYRHFSDKKELFITCINPLQDGAVEAGLEAVLQAPDLPGLVRSAFALRLRVMQEHLDSFRILFAEASHHPELVERFMQQAILNHGRHAAAIRARLAAAPELQRLPNPVILGLGLSTAIWAILTFGQRLTSLCPDPTLKWEPDRLLDELTQFVLYGLAGQPRERDTPCEM